MSFVLAAPVFATDENYPNHVIQLDWANKSTLSDSVVQLCDDTYFPAVEIVVPGRPYENFTVEMDSDVTSGKSILGCSVSIKQNANSTTYTVDSDNGACTIKIHKVRKSFEEKPQTAVYDINEAC